jgi:hypothetical protein
MTKELLQKLRCSDDPADKKESMNSKKKEQSEQDIIVHDEKKVVREKDGRWTKGHSGNPNGASIWNSKERVECVKKLNEAYSGITKKAIEMALNGDEGIIRLIMERVLPARIKDNPAPKGLLVGTLDEQAYNVMKAMDDGQLTPMEGKELLAGIKSTQEICEFSEFKKEIENIKKMLES